MVGPGEAGWTCEKNGFRRGGPSQKHKGKRGDHAKYFSKTLKWHNGLISEVIEFKRKKGAEEKVKESREAKDKSYKDCRWTELYEDVTKLKKLRVPELNKYFNHHGLKQHLRSNKSEKVKPIVRH